MVMEKITHQLEVVLCLQRHHYSWVWEFILSVKVSVGRSLVGDEPPWSSYYFNKALNHGIHQWMKHLQIVELLSSHNVMCCRSGEAHPSQSRPDCNCHGHCCLMSIVGSPASSFICCSRFCYFYSCDACKILVLGVPSHLVSSSCIMFLIKTV